MSDPKMIKAIKAAVTIPVMAKVRIGHFVEAQVNCCCFLCSISLLKNYNFSEEILRKVEKIMGLLEQFYVVFLNRFWKQLVLTMWTKARF